MATDKHATMDHHATVEAFSLWSVPRQQWGSRVFFAVCFVEVFSLWSIHGLYNQGHQPASLVKLAVSVESSAEELVDGQ
jgi:hypothetical protein